MAIAEDSLRFVKTFPVLRDLIPIGGRMSKTYQFIIKVLGGIACLLLLVALILYIKDDQGKAEIAVGIGAIVAGVAVMMYSLRR